MKKIKIRDLTLRDGQQSQLATRMNQDQIDRVLPYYRDANFYAMEVWGGAVPDSTMRYLGEDPWERLRKIKEGIGDASKLTALSRGRNLFGYNPYPDHAIEGFNRNSIETGVDIMRIFDALNDIENMKYTIKVVQENGGETDCAICFTTDPQITLADRIKGFFSGKKFPKAVFDIDYFVDKAKELEALGADIITIKDMAGLIHPSVAAPLYQKLKKTIKVPIDHHSHCTPGYGLASALMAIINGADIVDTVILNFSGGPAGPSFELIQIFCDKLGIETDVNLEAVAKINKELYHIRKELHEYDKMKIIPKQFDISKDKLPNEIDMLFDQAILAAEQNKHSRLLQFTHAINDFFHFPKPDAHVKEAQIPGGMYSNMLAQLDAAGKGHLLSDVLDEVPIVRVAAGVPPLVTPTSQIVGVQAVNNVIDAVKGNERYSSLTSQFVQLVEGGYGTTPVPIDPDFREKITGNREEKPYDTSKHEWQENPELPEFGEGVKLAMTEKEELLLELFPAVAKGFLRERREKEYQETTEKQSARIFEKEKKRFSELLSGITGDYQSLPDEEEIIL
ncbi:MAG: carboxylase [Candidatus Zixiibacteriota bacterium]